MMPATIEALRDGTRKNIASGDLVPGDIIYLEEGVKVPADGRLIEINSLKVDNSSLTGESEPQMRKLDRSPVFTKIGRTLSHGDDVYVVRFNIPSVDPNYMPPDWLMIDIPTFITWFNENNPENWENVGRQYREIALDILPNKLMDKY
jgi:magnesium-transporting ATPase (P-type)